MFKEVDYGNGRLYWFWLDHIVTNRPVNYEAYLFVVIKMEVVIQKITGCPGGGLKNIRRSSG